MIKNDVFRVEQNPTDSSKLTLTINKQPIDEWIKMQFYKLRNGLQTSFEDINKSRRFRM